MCLLEKMVKRSYSSRAPLQMRPLASARRIFGSESGSSKKSQCWLFFAGEIPTFYCSHPNLVLVQSPLMIVKCPSLVSQVLPQKSEIRHGTNLQISFVGNSPLDPTIVWFHAEIPGFFCRWRSMVGFNEGFKS